MISMFLYGEQPGQSLSYNHVFLKTAVDEFRNLIRIVLLRTLQLLVNFIDPPVLEIL